MLIFQRRRKDTDTDRKQPLIYLIISAYILSYVSRRFALSVQQQLHSKQCNLARSHQDLDRANRTHARDLENGKAITLNMSAQICREVSTIPGILIRSDGASLIETPHVRHGNTGPIVRERARNAPRSAASFWTNGPVSARRVMCANRCAENKIGFGVDNPSNVGYDALDRSHDIFYKIETWKQSCPGYKLLNTKKTKLSSIN